MGGKDRAESAGEVRRIGGAVAISVSVDVLSSSVIAIVQNRVSMVRGLSDERA
jgi:hypothetical protein